MSILIWLTLAFLSGLTVGAIVENYRARVIWGLELGSTWAPPKKAKP